MGLLCTGLGLVLLGLGGWRAARRLFLLPAGLPAALGAALLAWAWLTVGMMVLGAIGLIAIGPILAWAAAGLLPASRARRPPDDPPVEDPPGRAGGGMAAAIAVGLTLWASVVAFGPSLILPVKVISDGPIYHLYFAATWAKAGRLVLVPTPFGESAAPYFPAVGDLWLTWLFVLGRGDRLARVGQVPFLLLAAATAYGLARRAGADRSAATVATCLFATFMPLFVFSFEPNVDTPFAAGYGLAVWFTARSLLDESSSDARSLILACLAAGAAWGTKAPGIVFVPPLLGGIAVARLARGGTIARKGRDLAIVALVPMILEGPWLARNAWLTGNPLYPLRVVTFGRTILPGWFGPGAMATSPYYIPTGEWRAAIDSLLFMFDPRLVPFGVAAVLLGLIGRKSGGPAGQAVLVRAATWLALANLALFWLAIPYRTQQRFTLHAAGLLVVPLAAMLTGRRWLRGVAVALLALHILTPQPWPVPAPQGRPPWDLSPRVPGAAAGPVPLTTDLFGVAGITTPGLRPLPRPIAAGRLVVGLGCLVTAWLAIGGTGRTGRPRWGGAVAVGAVVAAGAGWLVLEENPSPIASRFPAFPDYRPAWVDLDDRLGSEGVRIAYAGMNLPYYLLGADFRNDARSINVDDHPGWLLHDYHARAVAEGRPTWPDTRPNWDRLRPDYPSWLANLEAARIDLLVVARANPQEGVLNPADAERFPVERSWADAHPDRFTLLYADPLWRTYRVRPENFATDRDPARH